jgi:hypothetical protein
MLDKIIWSVNLMGLELQTRFSALINARYPTRLAIAIMQTSIFIFIAILMTGVGVLGFALAIPFGLLWGLEAIINYLERRYDRLTQQKLNK